MPYVVKPTRHARVNSLAVCIVSVVTALRASPESGELIGWRSAYPNNWYQSHRGSIPLRIRESTALAGVEEAQGVGSTTGEEEQDGRHWSELRRRWPEGGLTDVVYAVAIELH